jgi:Collagen triple helix repeat (20 copies)
MTKYLGVFALAAILLSGSLASASTTRSKAVPVPRVGGSAQIGPVCWQKNGVHVQTDQGTMTLGGMARFIKLNQKCINRGEVRRYIKVPIRIKISRKNFIGPPGPAGAKGDKGDKGDTGAQGIAGAIGATGPRGLPGLTGAVGPMGPVGPQGPKGDKGDTGATGATGAVGPAGAQGPAGPAGPQGLKGDTGAVGPAGPQGLKGDTGAAGPAGPQGLKGDTGAVGPAGPAGPAGPTGPQGPKGDAGIGGLIGVSGGVATGDKQFSVLCPLNTATPDPTDRLEAISGGFDIQGSVTSDFMSDATGHVAIGAVKHEGWTVKQSSGNDLSGFVYVWCAPVSA